MTTSKVKKAQECSALLDIEVPKESVEQAFEEVYDDIVKVANLPGFRVGKAPKDLVRKHYVKDAREEVLKRLVPEAYRKALEEHKLQPVGMPTISEVNFEEGKRLSFKARVDTRPEFTIKNYKGLKLERKNTKVTPQDVQKTLESARDMHAKYIAADERPIQMGDYVVADLDCSVDGKPVHKKRENIWIAIEKESFIPGLAEKMIGMKNGEEKDIEATMPEKYPDSALAGKRATYHVAVKGVKIRQLPDIDDEFAKDLGKSDIASLKEEIAGSLASRMKATAETETENQLLNKLMDDNVFPVPQNLVKRQLDFMVENSKRRLEEKGFKREELDKKDEEFRAKFKSDALRQVRLLFVLDEIARREHIDVTEKDIAESYKSMAAQSGMTEQAVKEHYEKEDIVDNLIDKIREEKTTEFLLNNSEIINL